jgi:hypothetical protein
MGSSIVDKNEKQWYFSLKIISYFPFTPLETMPRCSAAGMKTNPFSANTGFKTLCEPSR